MDDAELLTRLESDVAALEEIARAGDGLDAEVPACPGWTASDLLGHLWSVQTWVVQILRSGKVATAPEPSADADQRVDDFVSGLPSYREHMRAIEPKRPCWGMGPEPRLAGYWIRRQAHEHAIHRLDLQQAGLGVPVPIASEFAVDGVDEVASIFHPRQVRLGRMAPLHAAVRLVAEDTGDVWVLGDGDSCGVATLTAPAQDLYLGLWGRLALLDAHTARLDGDRGAVERVLSSPLVP